LLETFIAFVIAVFFALWTHQYRALIYPINKAFPEQVSLLRSRDYSSTYHRYLAYFLDWLSKYFGTLNSNNRSPDPILYIKSALTGRSYDILLFIAILYPILFFLLEWVLGSSSALGTMELFEVEYEDISTPENIFRRLVAFSILLMVVGILYRSHVFALILFFTLLNLAFLCTIIFSFSIDYNTLIVVIFIAFISSLWAISGVTEIAGPLGVILGGSFAVLFSLSSAFDVSSAAATTVVSNEVVFNINVKNIIVILSVLIFASIVVSTNIESYFAIFVTVFLSLIYFFIGAAPFAMALTIIFLFVITIIFRSRVVRYAFLLLSAVIYIYLCASSDTSNYVWQKSQILILLMCILPLFNSPMDWISLGFTRGLLHFLSDGHQSKSELIVLSIIDAFIAVIFLFVVSATTVLGIWIMNYVSFYAGEVRIIDFENLLEQMQSNNLQGKLWIWLLLGSTLVPTAIHFISAIVALTVLLRNHEKTEEMADLLEEDRFLAVEEKKEKGSQDAAVITSHSSARLYAFIHLYVFPHIVFVVGLAAVYSTGMFLFKYLPEWMGFVLDLLGGDPLPK